VRYGDLKAENLHFSLPYSDLTPSLGVNIFEFLDEPYLLKLESGSDPSENSMILDYFVWTQYQRVRGGQTDGRTNGHADDSYIVKRLHT